SDSALAKNLALPDRNRIRDESGLKIPRRKACGFDSHRPHQIRRLGRWPPARRDRSKAGGEARAFGGRASGRPPPRNARAKLPPTARLAPRRTPRPVRLTPAAALARDERRDRGSQSNGK